MKEYPAQYNPKETEDKWYKFWEEKGFFHAKNNPDKKPYCIVIPPPNVTGILHMGHALNNTIQDILIRSHRMKGFEALWMPGTDHAGIATQNVVEKKLGKEALTRQDLGRDKFIEKVWLWRQEYGSTIIRQLKKLGSSCDWARTRFTMDEEYSKAVKSAFISLWNKGLIYQDNKVINWCPRCQTALSDEEAPHQELKGSLYYIRYPLKDKSQEFKHIVVATTRPETLLGDTAVAVNPKDKRYKKLTGETLILPLVNREINIIADDSVDKKFGTGAVKVTPAHDPNDYILGKKHGLEFIKVMSTDGRMNEFAGNYKGMDRFEAREVILEDLKCAGLLEKVQPHELSAGHCYRCHTIIEPYLSKQWFVKMKPLAKPAIEAVKKGKIKFHPSRWTKVYLNWMENIQDWCISRQIWWGHRIPLWYCCDCDEKVIAGEEVPKLCKACGSSNLKQEEDVLDTWFSSWLWPFATFGWPPGPEDKDKENKQADLKYFYPTSTLVTAPEIIFFWVARMIMAGLEFMKDIPFKDVYIHGTVRDIEGKKMSKSLGNIIDPLEIIEKYSADSLRYSLISLTSAGQDVFLSEQKFQQGRNFANKLWNAARFSLMNMEGFLESEAGKTDLCIHFKKENLSLADRWILSRFYSMLDSLDKALANYRFNEAANILYEFIWHEFCDWYIELIKPVLTAKEDGRNLLSSQLVLYKILEKTLRCLHPFMPFITEDIWQRLQNTASPHDKSIMLQNWPHMQKEMIDKSAQDKMQTAIDIIGAIRNLKAQVHAQELKGKVLLICSENELKLMDEISSYITLLGRLEELKYSNHSGLEHKNCISAIVGNIQIFLQLQGLINIPEELLRIKKEILKLEGGLKSKETCLKNKAFLKKAPKDIVEKEKEALSEIKETLNKLRKTQNELQG